jgi:hypothetical protein
MYRWNKAQYDVPGGANLLDFSESDRFLVCEEPDLVNGLDSTYSNGQVWLTVPPLGEAVGPIPLPDYIAHRSQVRSVPALAALGAKRIDPSTLPPC